MTRAEFAAAVSRMTKVPGGTVEVQDFYGVTGRAPYRYADLEMECSHADAPARAADLMRLAIEVRGYLAVNTHDDGCRLQIGLSRPLEPEEWRQHSTRALPVSLDAVLAEVGAA